MFISPFVLAEIQHGDPDAIRRRMEMVTDVTLLAVPDAAKPLGDSIARQLHIPPKALLDAYHIATAVVCEMEYLLTWNCTHINNSTMKPAIRSICVTLGYTMSEICTPEELMGTTEV